MGFSPVLMRGKKPRILNASALHFHSTNHFGRRMVKCHEGIRNSNFTPRQITMKTLKKIVALIGMEMGAGAVWLAVMFHGAFSNLQIFNGGDSHPKIFIS